MKFYLLKREHVGTTIPKIVFDNLASAKETDLKVILYVIHNNVNDAAVISRELNLNMLSVQSSLIYWSEKGLLHCDINDEPSPTKKKYVMTALDIMNMSQTIPEIGVLTSQLQQLFATTLNEKSTMNFIDLFLTDLIPVDSILTLTLYYLHHYEKDNQRKPSYIAKVIHNVNKKFDITTGEKAEEYIQLIQTRQKQYVSVSSIFEIPTQSLTTSEKTLIDSWFEKLNMSLDMIQKSYEVAGVKGEIKYCNSILKVWDRKGYTKVSDLADEIFNTISKENTKISSGNDILVQSNLLVPSLD